MLTKNPNAEVSIYTGAVAFLAAWGLGHFGVTDFGAEEGVALSTILTGIVLFAGRRSKKA